MTKDLKHIEKIEIRSEEVQDILGKPPKKIIRRGISVMLLFMIFLLVGAWFFKYPDIINSKIILTTKYPPINLKARTSGKIVNFFASEGDSISEGQVIAMVENTATYSDIMTLSTIIDTINHPYFFNDSIILNIGEIQAAYISHLRLIQDYKSFRNLGYHKNKIDAIKQQQKDYKLYYGQLLKQRQIKKTELDISSKQYNRDSILNIEEVLADAEFEVAKIKHLQFQYSLEYLEADLINTNMQINQLEKQILDLQLQRLKENQDFNNQLHESFLNLQYQIQSWKQDYLIVSPIEGTLSLTKIWHENQNVSAGDIVATVIPIKETEIIGKVRIPSAGAGKVKLGHRVNIKLDNFPYMQYGMIESTIKDVSEMPVKSQDETFYLAEIEISDSLISNYGTHLDFTQEMTGTAEIITDDIRLLERLFHPLKAVLNKQINL